MEAKRRCLVCILHTAEYLILTFIDHRGFRWQGNNDHWSKTDECLLKWGAVCLQRSLQVVEVSVIFKHRHGARNWVIFKIHVSLITSGSQQSKACKRLYVCYIKHTKFTIWWSAVTSTLQLFNNNTHDFRSAGRMRSDTLTVGRIHRYNYDIWSIGSQVKWETWFDLGKIPTYEVFFNIHGKTSPESE